MRVNEENKKKGWNERQGWMGWIEGLKKGERWEVGVGVDVEMNERKKKG